MPLQVDAAFEYLQRSEAVDALAIRYDLSVVASGSTGLRSTANSRGIYIRKVWNVWGWEHL